MKLSLRHNLFFFSFANVILLLLMQISCGQRNNKTRPPRLPPFVVASEVQIRDVVEEVRAPIDLEPIAQVEVGSKTLGYLDLVLVDRGDVVKKRQLLALVRPSDLPQQLAEARSALAQTQASLLLAKSNYERAKQLSPTGIVSQQELQQTLAAVTAAVAAEAAAKERIAALGIRLGETRIESPINGLVAQRRLDPGALVGPSGIGTIMTLVRTDMLRAFLSVNERSAAKVAVGQEALIELDALPGKRFSGKVVRLSPAFDPTTRTIDAEIHLANQSGILRPGMYGRGAIVVGLHPQAVTVPISAVQISLENKYVYIVKRDRVYQRIITTGVDNENWIEVTNGLKKGEKVVTAGVESLTDGLAVRVAEDVDPFSGKKIPKSEQTPRDANKKTKIRSRYQDKS